MSGKCPKCEQVIGNVLLEPGPLGNRFSGPMLAGFVALCPHCKTVLGVTADPDAIANTVVQRLAKKR
jgi:phage FluMu protein Com